ncbi:MAG TPA: methyltransferase [Pyrinomonadaceae bacterium]|nr:methyltransferase [Pyrinomonadaceae bacterium]
MNNVTPERIIEVANGFVAAKYLFVANDVGLFESLADGPATLEELTQRTGVPRRTLRILTDAVTALGFLERQDHRYQNSPVAATFLSGRTPGDLRPFLRFWDRLGYPTWMRLEEAIRTDQTTFEGFTEEQQQLYSDGVEAITSGTAQALATAYDFSQHRRVLDLGGGTGSFLVAVLNRYSGLEGTLYELPPVAEIARQRLSSSPLAERIKVVEADFFKDPVPGGHDAFILANILHCFSPERDLELLRGIRRQVDGGARLLLVDFWTDPTHTEPAFAALMAGEFLLIPGGGDVYSAEEARVWLQESGWRTVEHKALAGPASVIVAEVVES